MLRACVRRLIGRNTVVRNVWAIGKQREPSYITGIDRPAWVICNRQEIWTVRLRDSIGQWTERR